jgi:hypothetical protein
MGVLTQIPGLQDLVHGIDLTTIAGPVSQLQLNQLIDQANPNSQIGFILNTQDTNGVPNVPNPTIAGYSKWMGYVWRRIVTSASGVIIEVYTYQWNPSIASDATYLQWELLISKSLLGTALTGNSRILQELCYNDSSTISLANQAILPTNASTYGVTIPNLIATITPVSNLSTLIIEACINFGVTTGGTADLYTMASNLYAGITPGVSLPTIMAVNSFYTPAAIQQSACGSTGLLIHRYSYKPATTNTIVITPSIGWLVAANGSGVAIAGAYYNGVYYNNGGTVALSSYPVNSFLKVVEYL